MYFFHDWLRYLPTDFSTREEKKLDAPHAGALSITPWPLGRVPLHRPEGFVFIGNAVFCSIGLLADNCN